MVAPRVKDGYGGAQSLVKIQLRLGFMKEMLAPRVQEGDGDAQSLGCMEMVVYKDGCTQIFAKNMFAQEMHGDGGTQSLGKRQLRVQEGGDGAYSLGRIWWHLEFKKEVMEVLKEQEEQAKMEEVQKEQEVQEEYGDTQSLGRR